MDLSPELQLPRKRVFHRLHSFSESEDRTWITNRSSDTFVQKIPVRKISEPCKKVSDRLKKTPEPSRKISEPCRRNSKSTLTVLNSPPISNGIWNWYSRLSSNVKKNLQSPKVIKRFLVSCILFMVIIKYR